MPGCIGALIADVQAQRQMDPRGPLFLPAMGHDIPTAIKTIGKMQEADGEENIFVVIAHDYSLRGAVDFFPKALNEWKTRGWDQRLRWTFLNDLEQPIKEMGLA